MQETARPSFIGKLQANVVFTKSF